MARSAIAGDAKAALGLALGLAVVTSLLQVGALAYVVGPIVFVLVIYAMTRIPIRYSMLMLMFLALTLENPADAPAAGEYQSPFFVAGAILLTHINTLDRSVFGWASFSGMDLCLVSLLLIAWFRKSTGSRIDSEGRVPTPEPLVRLALLSLASILYVWMSGLVRGGDFRMSLWQLDRVMYLPVIFLLFSFGLRGPADHRALAKVFLSAATLRAVIAMLIHWLVRSANVNETGTTVLPYATSHHDSMQFANAFIMLFAILMERLEKSTRRLAFVLLPVIAGGMIANGRRMAWVQVAVVFLTVYLVSPDNPFKKKLRTTLMALALPLVVYLAVGWDMKGGIFKPVQMVRSVVDPQTDGSTLWREIENYDIISTFKQFPILGTGYGHGYWEVIPIPYIPYELEHYAPHNSILGLWCYCGYFGYAGLTLLWSCGVYFSMRAYHHAKDRSHRAAALVSFGAVLVYMVQCWGDMGLGSWIGVFSVGAALNVGGKLAVAVGQWGPKKRGAPRVARVGPAGVAAAPGHAA